MLRKKLGTAASVMAAIGMVFPMTVGFTQTDALSSAAGAQHQQAYKAKANHGTTEDLVNDIQNAKVDKYQALIEMKIQESKQSSESHKTAVKHTVKKAATRQTTNQPAKRTVVNKTAEPKTAKPVALTAKETKPVVHTSKEANKVTTDKADSQRKPEVKATARKQQAPVISVATKKTAAVKAPKKAGVIKKTAETKSAPVVNKKVARTDSESIKAKGASATPAVQKKVPATAKPVSRQTTVKPVAEHHTESAAEESQRSVAPRQQKSAQAPQTTSKAVQPTSETTQSSIKAVHQPVNSNKAVQSANGSSETFKLTAYSLKGTTATGVNLTANPNAKVVAVDPNVIPLHSKVTIPGLGTYSAEDTGGAIQGHRIDVHMSSTQAARNFGVRTTSVTVQR